MRLVLTRLIADGVREFDLELAIPAEQLAVAIDALADGIARQKLADRSCSRRADGHGAVAAVRRRHASGGRHRHA